MKLHLGCGKRHIPGFVHIDAIDYPHIDHVSSIDNLSFVGDQSVDLIYNCHVLEHFKRRDVERVAKEWFRVLKPGGVLRTSVPDFKALCEIYSRSKDIEDVIGPLFGRQDYLYNIHYNVFDFASLALIFESVGFIAVQPYDWRETEHAHIDDYAQAYWPHMNKETGIQVSCNVECKRPA